MSYLKDPEDYDNFAEWMAASKKEYEDIMKKAKDNYPEISIPTEENDEIHTIQITDTLRTIIYKCSCGKERFMRTYIDHDDSEGSKSFEDQTRALTGDKCYCLINK